MKNFEIVDIVKKIVIFICVSIAMLALILLFATMFGPSSPFILSYGENMITILIWTFFAIIAKYTGDIAIVVLKSKRE